MAYKCPYCNVVCRDDGAITKNVYETFNSSGIMAFRSDACAAVILSLSKCPNCGEASVRLTGKNITPYSYPPAAAIHLPEYIPNAIRSDYMEALSIVNASPKASATLSRRCLQGMIHDYWGIHEKNLNAEITSLKGKVEPAQWKAMDALRKIGNIGAHMESDINLIVDVEPEEAQSLIKLIELLIEKWYIARHDAESLYAEIENIGAQKEAERKSNPGNSNS